MWVSKKCFSLTNKNGENTKMKLKIRRFFSFWIPNAIASLSFDDNINPLMPSVLNIGR